MPVEAHWSLIVAFIWFPLVLAGAYRDALPELSTSTVTAMTLASVVLLEVSIVLHEFGHALQARREGLGVERVLLWAVGGLAYISGFGRFSPGADLRITAAGPLVSLVLALVFGPLALLASASGWPDSVLGLLAFLGIANTLLLAFNLLPIFPLDGGRLLHGVLWRMRGYAAASVWTTRVGLAAAGSLLAAGIVLPFFVVVAPVSGVYFTLVAGMLLVSTYAIRPPIEMAAPPIRRRQVADLLAPHPVLPSPDTPVGSFLDLLTRAGGQAAAAYPVVHDGKVVGVISPGIASEGLEQGRTVAEVMLRKGDAVILRPEMSIEEAYAALGENPSAKGLVLVGTRLAGILRGSDLAGALLEARESPQGALVPATPPRIQVDW